jgi:acyl-CoA reductase-like NAD-dependent aldehyde dehydrogenase
MATTAVSHHPMRIGGEAVDADELYEIVNPASEEVFATAAKGSVAHADRAVAAAKAAHERGEWRALAPAERADVLDAICARMSEQMDELCALQVAENGATIRQAMAFHIGYSISHLQYFADLCRTYAFEHSGPALSYPTLAAGRVRREPIGVCAGIVPWNFPLLLAVWKLGPALAAGNTIVLKPDEKTPLTLLALARIAEECGLPAGVLNVVTGEGEEVGAHLAAHADVRKIAFTGSTAVGREIMRTAAGNVKRVTLELGGKGPNVILDDADVDTAVDAALFGCYLYSGQACESGTRLLLPDALHDDFVERMVARASKIVVGDPADFGTDVGPVISAEQRGRILGYIEHGKRQGATVALGGGTPDRDKGYWVQPTIFTGVTNDMTIAREEIFGPVISVIRYSSVEEAVAIANDTEYGLSAGVWSSDNERALEVAEQLEAGTVWVNDWHMVSCEYPFGGYKQSGFGRELGPHALDEYTEEKFIHLDLSGRRDRRVYDMIVPGRET